MLGLAEAHTPPKSVSKGLRRETRPWRSDAAPADAADEFLSRIYEYKDQFYRFVRRTLWDQEAVDDVFSSAVVAAYENRHKYTPGTNFRAWMFRILQNKCFVANRQTSRTMQPLDQLENIDVAVAQEPEQWDVLNDPKSFLEECGDEVFHAFERLSTAQRNCIMLRSVERFTYKEIADILEMPIGTVMTHLARGRAKLRKELAGYAKFRGILRNN